MAFVHDMIRRFRSLDGAAFELQTDTRNDAWENTLVTRKLQISGDLGLRMVHTLKTGLEEGYRRVLIAGSDAPTLPADHVRSLLASDKDVALGPSEDGGFYAISASRVDSEMFKGVRWSQPKTLVETMNAIRRCGLSVELGPQWFDVDEPADLERLVAEGGLPPETSACLARLTAMRRDSD